MIENPKVGDRVSYADAANPRKVGTIREERHGQFRVEWDEDKPNYAETWSDLRQAGWKVVDSPTDPDYVLHREAKHDERRREVLGTLEKRATNALDHRRALELAAELVECGYCAPIQPFEARALFAKLTRELDVLHEVVDGALEPMDRHAKALRRNAPRRKNEQSRRDAIRRADRLDDLVDKARIVSYARAAILETLGQRAS